MNEPNAEGHGEAQTTAEVLQVNNEFTPLFYDKSHLRISFDNEGFRLENQHLDILYVYVGELLAQSMKSNGEVVTAVANALSESIKQVREDLAVGRRLEEQAKLTLDSIPPRMRAAFTYELNRRKSYQEADEKGKANQFFLAFMRVDSRFSDYMFDIRDDLRTVVLTNLIAHGYLGEDARKQIDQIDFSASVAQDPKAHRASEVPMPEPTLSTPEAQPSRGGGIMKRVRSFLNRS